MGHDFSHGHHTAPGLVVLILGEEAGVQMAPASCARRLRRRTARERPTENASWQRQANAFHKCNVVTDGLSLGEGVPGWVHGIPGWRELVLMERFGYNYKDLL